MSHKSILRAFDCLLFIFVTFKMCAVECQLHDDHTQPFSTNVMRMMQLNQALASDQNRQVNQGPERSYYSINLLVSLNDTLYFPSLNGSIINTWLLTRLTNFTYYQQQQNPNLSIQIKPQPIFDVGTPAVRNQTIRQTFQCSPSETDCSQLSVPNFNVKYIGHYTSFSRSVDYLYDYRVDYNVSAYVEPLKFNCMGLTSSSQNNCIYNDSIQTLNVVKDVPVQLSCSVLIAQNDLYQTSANIIIRSDMNQECVGTTSLTLMPNQEVLNTFSNTNGDTNVLLYKLTKTCNKTFSQYDQTKSFTCTLVPTLQNQTAPMELQTFEPYENIIVKLNVNYGPDIDPSFNSSMNSFNKTIIASSSQPISFTCPFSGNPMPMFYWSVPSLSSTNDTQFKSSKYQQKQSSPTGFYLSTQVYTVPSKYTGTVGSYVFECYATVGGLLNENSSVVQFYLNILPLPVNMNKKALSMNSENPLIKKEVNNTGAIIGGTIGGVVVILIILLAIVFLIRRKKNSKDDIEKAKEIDIDIADSHDNPHLSSRNNLTDLNSNHGQQQHKNASHKVIAGLMVPTSTAQSYAAIAHAAAAAAQSNQQRNSQLQNASVNHMDFNAGSVNNLLGSNTESNHLNANMKSQSYNNPGFFESAAYSIPQNPLESPPPYDAALQQPIKKNSPNHQQQLQQQQNLTNTQQQQLFIQQQQRDYMGSNTKLISGHNTPTLQKHLGPTSHSYSMHNQNNLSLLNPTQVMSASLQQLHYQQQIMQQQQLQQQSNLQYTTVQSLENRARSRNPLNGMSNEMDSQSQPTQYSNIAQLNPIDV